MMIQSQPILGSGTHRERRFAPLRGVVMRLLLGSALVGALLAISGCGQKGRLYLPPADSAQHTSATQP